MRTKIIPIGNSQGVRIPKVLLEGISLDAEVEVKRSQNGLTIIPIVAWKPAVSEAALLSQRALGQDWNRPEEDEAWQDL